MRKALCRSMMALLLMSSGALLGQTNPRATMTVTAAPGNATGSMAVSFNGYTETIGYGPFSSPESLAADFAAKFSHDYIHDGLYAKAFVNNANPNVIVFELTNGTTFGPVTYSQDVAPYTLIPSGFATTSSENADSGTITLFVNNNPIASTRYVDGSIPSEIADGLVQTASSNDVNVQYDGSLLYLTPKHPGTNQTITWQITYAPDSNSFPTSFDITPQSGTIYTGASATGPASQIYCYSITSGNACVDPATFSPSSVADGYDHAGNVVHVADSVMGTWAYGYDNLNRLVTGSSDGAVYPTAPDLCWSYDAYGNRLEQTASTSPFLVSNSACSSRSSGTIVSSLTTTPNTKNQIDATSTVTVALSCPAGSSAGSASGLCYDAAGNVAKDASNTYLYDAEGRLCAVHGAYGMTAYLYNADGVRVGKGSITSFSCDVTANGYQATSDYVLDLNDRQMSELEVDANNQAVWQHTNIWSNGILVGTDDVTGWHFYANDWLGTRRAEASFAGFWEQNCQNLPYGDSLACTQSIDGPTEHHFAGKERDAESGLDYFGARYSGSSMGRFTSPDPVVITKMRMLDPEEFNMYAYVKNNPLRYTDPTGKDLWMRGCGKNSSTCNKNYVGSWDKNHKKFTPTTIQSDKRGNFAGHSVDFDDKGIHVDGKYQGVFASKTDPTVVNGSGMFSGFQANFSNNIFGHAEASGVVYPLAGHSWSQFDFSQMRGPNEKLDAASHYFTDHVGDQYRGGNSSGPDVHLDFVSGSSSQSMHFDWAFPWNTVQGLSNHTRDYIDIEIDTKIGRSDPSYEEVGP